MELSPRAKELIARSEQNATAPIRILTEVVEAVRQVNEAIDNANDNTIEGNGKTTAELQNAVEAIRDISIPEMPGNDDIVTALSKLESSIIKAVKGIELKPEYKPNIQVDSPEVNIETPEIDLSGITKVLKKDMPQAFEKAIKQIPTAQAPDFKPLEEKLTDAIEWLKSIDTASRLKPKMPTTLKVTNVDGSPIGGGSSNPNGQTIMANSAPVVLSSDYYQNIDLPILTPTFSGLTPSSTIPDVDVSKANGVLVSFRTGAVSGGIIIMQVSQTGGSGTWHTAPFKTTYTATPSILAQTITFGANTNYSFICEVPGWTYFRMIVNTTLGSAFSELQVAPVQQMPEVNPVIAGVSTSALQTTGNTSLANINTGLSNGTQLAQIYDSTTNTNGRVDAFANLRVAQQKRVIGGNFGSTIDTTFTYVKTNVGTGDTTAALAEAIIATGATANSSAKLMTINKIRYLSGRNNLFRAVMRFGDTGTTNNVREFGIYVDATNQFVFRLSGTTFSVVTKRNNVETVVTSGNFNGNGTGTGGTYTVDLNYHAFEILYATSSIRFMIDNVPIHVVRATTSSIVGGLVGQMYASNVNSSGLATNLTLNVLTWSTSHLGNAVNNPSYFNISAATAGTQLKSGGGTLQTLMLSRAGGLSAQINVYDSVGTATNLIGQWDMATGTSVGQYQFGPDGMNFYNGLYVTATGTVVPGSATILWE